MAAETDAPIGEPPGFFESAESSIKALFRPTAEFSQLRFRPTPDLPRSLLLISAWIAVGNAFTLLLLWMQTTGANLLPMIVAFVAATVTFIPIGLTAAAVFHAFALFAGGKQTFLRSLQTFSLIAAIYPLSIGIWALPIPPATAALLITAYATYSVVRAVERMHEAPLGQAWIVFGVCGALAATGQFIFQREIGQLQTRAQTLASLYSAASSLKSIAAMSTAPAAPAQPDPGAFSSSNPAGVPAVPELAGVKDLAAEARSGLDLISRLSESAPNDGSAASDPAAARSPSQLQLGTMKGSALDFVRGEVAKNPHALDTMTPEQRRQIAQALKGVFNELPIPGTLVDSSFQSPASSAGNTAPRRHSTPPAPGSEPSAQP